MTLGLLLGARTAFAAAPLHGGQTQEAGPPGGQGPDDGQRMPVFGKITTLGPKSIEIQNVNGENVVIKLTDKTEFRKDRQPAKRTDFKVGDIILVRGEENADHSWNAQIIAARSMNGPGGLGGPGGPNGPRREAGTLGKDFVTGEIKNVDAPKLSVLRTDNVTQTIELNEDTSLRKGRDAITMADIQQGDHVFARGGLENNVFVPKVVVIIAPEQWKRMQEWSGQGGGQRRRGPGGPGGAGGANAAEGSSAGAPSAAPSANAPAAQSPGDGSSGAAGSNVQKPAEPQH
jgi:Domain of unknown function (DUF5666)